MKKIITFFALFVIHVAITAAPLRWQNLAPGLEYSGVNFLGFGGKGIYIFRIDLQKYRLQSTFTRKEQQVESIAAVVKNQNAIIGINGGFFSPDMKPLGLRIDQGQIKNPLKNTSWWGVFYTKNSQAFIVAPKDFRANSNIDFAVQSGPRLVVNGQISSLKPGVANRTALGITPDGKIILLATSHFPLTMSELATLMATPTAQGGLNCINAINLDGGSSTQLYAKLDNFELSIPSFAFVTDAVLVMRKI